MNVLAEVSIKVGKGDTLKYRLIMFPNRFEVQQWFDKKWTKKNWESAGEIESGHPLSPSRTT